MSTKSLIDKLRKARQQRVESHGKVFTVRRPNDVEWLDLRLDGGMNPKNIIKFVCGWENMTQHDLGIPGGTADVVPFDHDLYMEWIADHYEHWEDISKAVVDSYKKHDEEITELLKNSNPGS